MKKQLLAMFAAAALFAGCSSDEMNNINGGENNGNGATGTVETATYFAVSTDEGIGIMASSASNAPEARAHQLDKEYTVWIKSKGNSHWQWCETCEGYCFHWNNGQGWICQCGNGSDCNKCDNKENKCEPKYTGTPEDYDEEYDDQAPDQGGDQGGEGENPGDGEGGDQGGEGGGDEGETPVPGSDITLDFCINLSDVLENAFTMETDDFYIRINGDYIESATWIDGVKSTSNKALIGIDGNDNLRISIIGLEQIPTDKAGYDYTFEAYLWVKNEAPLNDGTGGYGQLFDESMKAKWVNHAEGGDSEAGCNINCQTDGEDGLCLTSNTWYGPKYGYEVRYNVYRGISGRPATDGQGNYTSAYGDSPYIKVSVHVTRVADDELSTVTPIYLSWED